MQQKYLIKIDGFGQLYEVAEKTEAAAITTLSVYLGVPPHKMWAKKADK